MQKYLKQIKDIDEVIKDLSMQLDRVGRLRVMNFLVILVGLWLGYNRKLSLGYGIAGLALFNFIRLVKRYHKLYKERDYESCKRKVVQDYIKRLDKGWLEFEETGQAYIDEKLPLIKDLDLLGRGSIYQLVCLAHTPYGKKKLAKALTLGVENESIPIRQRAICELLHKESFALHLKTLSRQLKEQKQKVNEACIEAFIKRAEGTLKAQNRIVKGLSFVLPIISVFSLIVFWIDGEKRFYGILALISIGMQILMSMFTYMKHSELFTDILNFTRNIELYKAFILGVEEEEFQSEYLKALQESLVTQGSVKAAFKGLDTLNKGLMVRFNIIPYSVISGLFMWDFHCETIFYKWKEQYGASVYKWLEVIGEFEALLSLAVMGEVKETYSFPIINESKTPSISFTDLRHPLLQKAVENSLDVTNDTYIITGSNMSGKTTFLRTIGINLALAYAGAPVLATHFKASRMEILTSMRMQDDVNEGISSFYAELLRIKEMLEASHKQKPMLALIDEIFKGTNSKDRILGAKETIKALEHPWVTLMVSTHDFELCEIEAPKGEVRTIYNYHFEEYYEENQIKFDYKLKKERCQTTNAKFLLKMVGITK